MHIENIVIGKPIVNLGILLGMDKDDNSFQEVTLYESERNLANILVKHGIMQSKREIKRSRPDLMKTLDKLDCFEIKIAKDKFYIVVGVDTDKDVSTILEIPLEENID